MLRLGFLLFFVTIAAAQVPQQTAYIQLETTASADLRGTLTVYSRDVPAGLPAAFARAMGCGLPSPQKSFPSRVVVQCPAGHPSVLTFTHAVRFDDLARLLRYGGIRKVDLTVARSHFGFLRLTPDIPAHGQYAIDELPSHLLIDGGFEADRVRALAAFTVGLMLTPLLLGLLRPADPLHRRAQIEAIFVLGWISWIWVLLRAQAGALLVYFFGARTVEPLLVLLVPPLVAVWIGSRVAAVPKGLDASRHRHVRFWTGAAFTCLAATLLNILLVSFNAAPNSIVLGFVLATLCVLRLRAVARGGIRSISEGDLRKRAFQLAATAGVPLRGVSLLATPTPRPVALAARRGIVFLNEGLLRHLSRREVDAVLGHEFSHFGSSNRSAISGIVVLGMALELAVIWVPNFADAVPVLLLAAYLLFKLWRRRGEYQADRNSVRWVGDPEALITGLARVSHAHGMPLDWGAPISWMMPHPPTMARFRAIARAGGITNTRVAELLQESRLETTDHYEETQPAAIAEDAAYSPALRQRWRASLTWYLSLAPVVCGLPTVWLLERIGVPWWAVLLLGSLLSALAAYLGFEWVTGSVRNQVKKRAIARYGSGVFAGFSPAAEPRVFDGSFQYDLGMVRFVSGMLEFTGDRARFALDRASVQRVWLGDGPRHWTPRKAVYIECRPTTECGPIIFSLQCMEAWLWPATVAQAKRLYRSVEEWHKASSSPEPAGQPRPVPQAQGSPSPTIPFKTAFRWFGIYAAVACVLNSFWNRDQPQVLCAAVVCGLLSFFLLWPRLRWGSLHPAIMKVGAES